MFWARRVNRDGWQFAGRYAQRRNAAGSDVPRTGGGDRPAARARAGAGRNAGLVALPAAQRYLRNERPLCIGQNRCGSCCALVGSESIVRLDAGEKPEFDRWCWVDFWYRPVTGVVQAPHLSAPWPVRAAGGNQLPGAARAPDGGEVVSALWPAPAETGWRPPVIDNHSHLQWNGRRGHAMYVCICNGDYRQRPSATAAAAGVATLPTARHAHRLRSQLR